jgi:hypothetical protein
MGMTVTVHKAIFSPTSHPRNAELWLSDREAGSDAKVLIRARFEFEAKGDQKRSLLVVKALDQLHNIVGEAREAASSVHFTAIRQPYDHKE